MSRGYIISSICVHLHINYRIETLKMQVHQYDKQRQEDLYNMSTLSREKEALAKADIRRLQEKFKDIFEEFHRSMAGKDGKLRSDIQGRVAELERVSGKVSHLFILIIKYAYKA